MTAFTCVLGSSSSGTRLKLDRPLVCSITFDLAASMAPSSRFVVLVVVVVVVLVVILVVVLVLVVVDLATLR